MALSRITNGGVASSGLPSGSIIQVQRTQFTGTNSITCTTGTDTVLTDLTVNITPQSADSVIKLEGMVNGEWGTTGHYNSTVFFFRDTTKLAHQTAGNRNVGVSQFFPAYYVADASSTGEGTGTFHYYDQPNTTDQIAYKIGVNIAVNGNPVFYLNRTVTDDDNNGRERFISLISATEIAG